MPFSVSRWPYSPDPRGPYFGTRGMVPPSCSPWKWRVSTTYAPGVWVPVMAGAVIPTIDYGDDFVHWQLTDWPVTGGHTDIHLYMQEEPDVSPLDWTARYVLDFVNIGTDSWQSVLELSFPDAIPASISMDFTSGSPNPPDMPGPCLLVPQAYQIPDGP